MLTVFKEPDELSAYVLGVDTAEGLKHGDYSCVQVINVKNGAQDAIWHGRIPPDELAVDVRRIGLWYGAALCCVESNNHGLTTLTALRQLGYPNLFRRRSVNQVDQRISQEYGFKTTRVTKPLIIDELGSALRNGEIIIRDEHTLAELKTFTRSERGTMSGSPFDDRVMALALSNHMRQFVNAPEFAPIVDDEYTFDWWMRLALSNKDYDGSIGRSTQRGTV